jgi:hypothetical protein
LRGFGDKPGGVRSIGNSLRFRNPNFITTIQVKIKATDWYFPYCGDEEWNLPFTTAGIGGAFFCAQEPCEDGIYQVTADIFLQPDYGPDSGDSLEIRIKVALCTGELCTAAENIDYHTIGTAMMDEEVTVTMHYDPDNNQFIFQKDNENLYYVPYIDFLDAYFGSGGWNEYPTPYPYRGLGVAHGFPDDCGEILNPEGFIEVHFDDVKTNVELSLSP